MFEPIINQFNEHIDICSRNIETLTPAISQAADAISNTLLKQGKIICIGLHHSQIIAQQFCDYMQTQFDNERPALPAINFSHLASEHLATNLSAVAQVNDLILLFDHPGDNQTSKQIAQYCKHSNLPIVLCGYEDYGDSQDTILLTLSNLKPSNVLEMQLLIMHILCKLIDFQLFGYEEPQ